eukprot:scaffold64909_cov40-Phaeocystis_antarctica.AAC.1
MLTCRWSARVAAKRSLVTSSTMDSGSSIEAGSTWSGSVLGLGLGLGLGSGLGLGLGLRSNQLRGGRAAR